MGLQANPYPLRKDKTLMAKFKVIANDNGRSVNKEIEVAIKRIISDYEKEHGEIKVDLDL